MKYDINISDLIILDKYGHKVDLSYIDIKVIAKEIKKLLQNKNVLNNIEIVK